MELEEAINKLKLMEYKYTLTNNDDVAIDTVLKELDRLQKNNKELNLENQALYESINCNDDNMLARRYEKLQKELEQEKEKNATLEQLLQGNLYEMYLYYKGLASSYQANCVSKDKITDKIKELENKKEQYAEMPLIYEILKNQLEELLKE